MIDLHDINALMVTLPWPEAETNEASAIMGNDFWYMASLGTCRRLQRLLNNVKLNELFHPSTFDVAKV